MTRTQKLIIAFWVFIGVMIIWSFFSYNSSLNEQAAQHPTQTSFIFLPAKAAPVAPSEAHSDKADVQQTGYFVEMDAPSTGYFTSHVTLTNQGRMPATGVQISVRPYRGASNYDEDVGHQRSGTLSDDDPLARLNDWLQFPDLAPGESITRTVSFLTRTEIKPGPNPKPEILFISDKNGPKTPRPPDPTQPAPSTAPSVYPTPQVTPRTHHSSDD